jgi:hypothetical protein
VTTRMKLDHALRQLRDALRRFQCGLLCPDSDRDVAIPAVAKPIDVMLEHLHSGRQARPAGRHSSVA